jgi:hypothetical protein
MTEVSEYSNSKPQTILSALWDLEQRKSRKNGCVQFPSTKWVNDKYLTDTYTPRDDLHVQQCIWLVGT